MKNVLPYENWNWVICVNNFKSSTINLYNLFCIDGVDSHESSVVGSVRHLALPGLLAIWRLLYGIFSKSSKSVKENCKFLVSEN